MSIESAKKAMDRVFHDISVPIETTRERLREIVEYGEELVQHLGETQGSADKRVRDG